MKDLEFTITIHAPREKVWNALWEDKNYREWTSAFTEGSWVKTDWKKGSKVLFLDSEDNGMSSVIEELIPDEFMSFRHMGTILKGKELMDRQEDDAWRGAHENYTLKAVSGGTELSTLLEAKGMDENMLEYFNGAWPKALQKLKAVAERN